MRAIDADSLNQYKFGEGLMASAYADGWDDAIDAIMKDAPTIEERPKGKWINRLYMYPERNIEMYACTECQYEYSYDAETGISDANFCPNCGADMRKEKST